jgi:NAD(P)-dependent dehydrogenase (short-subunit alcohol dehydrogenase family)
MDLDGKTALVTGGADGIGAGIAERLAAEGMHVVIADVDQGAGAATASRIGGSSVCADVATTAGVRAAVDAACRSSGPLGVLVANAGGAAAPSFPAADPERWGYTLDLNLRAVMLATQLVLDPMAAGGGGAVITIASVAGLGTTGHDSPEYAAAKAGLMRFTECLAPLRDSIGVRVNGICPGLVDTPSSRRSRARLTPAGRADLPLALAPADIATAAMRFLADDTLAGRIMVCRGGEPSRLLPLVDWQTALSDPAAYRRNSPLHGAPDVRHVVQAVQIGAWDPGIGVVESGGPCLIVDVDVLASVGFLCHTGCTLRPRTRRRRGCPRQRPRPWPPRPRRCPQRRRRPPRSAPTDQRSGNDCPHSPFGRGPKMRRSASAMGTSLMLASRRIM